MTNSFCLASKCKVKRMPNFDEIEKWSKEEGLSFNEIYRHCKEKAPDSCPSIPTIAEHFNKHYAPITKDLETFSPERMAKLLDDNISTCNRAIKRAEDEGDLRVMSQIMDTQKRLLELKIQNQQMFIEKAKTLPEQFDNLKEVLEDIPPMYQEKVLKALEQDIYGGKG